MLLQDKDDLEYMRRKIKEEYEKWESSINTDKTQYLCIGNPQIKLQLEDNGDIKGCRTCKYLGVLAIENGKDKEEIRQRIVLVRKAIRG